MSLRPLHSAIKSCGGGGKKIVFGNNVKFHGVYSCFCNPADAKSVL
jgi:hypothetical protein